VPDEPRLRRSSLLAGVAEGVVATALPLLATNITRDPLAVAGVVVAQHLPWIGVALGWHLVSRRDRRTMIGLIDTVRALAVGYLGLLALAGADTILKIQVVAFIVGLGEALTGTIEEETGDSRLSMRGMLGLAVIGMPLGGLLYAVFLAVPFMIDVLFFALAALFALFIPGPVRAARSLGDSSPARLAEGTLPVTITALVASVARSAVLGVLVLFALDNLGLGAPAFGFLLAGLAAATAAGGWVAPEAGTALGLRRGFAVASVVSGVALVIAATVADPARPWAAALALGIAWASATTGMVLLRALLPVAAGRPVTGPALRAFHLVEWGGLCGGALAGGWLARGHGVDVVLVCAAGAWAVAAVSVAVVRRSEPAMTISTDSANWLDAA
jgi:hypothetical protein